MGLAIQTHQATAAGGNGISVINDGVGGAGGNNGPLTDAIGKDGGDGSNSQGTGGGGGGATDTSTGNGAAGGSRGGTASAYIGFKGATGSVGLVVESDTDISTALSGGDGGAGQIAVNNVNTSGGGGGGGAGIQSSGAIFVSGAGFIKGGNGVAGNGAAGGGGGVGIFSSSNVSVYAGGSVFGGNGGGSAISGAGGQGAAGIMLSKGAVIENSGFISGGSGGRGGLNSGGGDGGSGIEMLLGGKIINAEAGVISGGSGGIGRYNPSSMTTPIPITPGKGGNGVNGADIIVINAGTISAGSGGTGSGWTPQSGVAVHFTGGINALELWSTSAINGLVLADGGDDRFILGGVVDGIFDTGAIGSGQQYDGFEDFEKTGAAVWTLNGSTNAITPWVVSEGILSVSSDDSLGAADGALTLNGGALRTTADIISERQVVLTTSGGTIEAATSTEFTSTGIISSVGSLIKTGAGSVTLSGKNTYTGETIISEGSLSLSGAGDISRSDRVNVTGVFDISNASDVTIRRLTGNGIVEIGLSALTLSNANDAFAGALSGTGAFSLASGWQSLTGNSESYGGELNVLGGILSVIGTVGGTANVKLGGVLEGTGIVGTTVNSGIIAPGQTPGGTQGTLGSIGTLTIAGNYTGEGGFLSLDTVLDGDHSATDMLVVTGDTSGSTKVVVTNVGGMGAQTVDGIKVIEVGGASAGAFNLQGDYVHEGQQAIVVGAYTYKLYQGSVSAPTDGNWYLRSQLKPTVPVDPVDPVDPVAPVDPVDPVDPVEPEEPLYQAGVPVYEAYPQALLGLNGVSTLQQRTGNRVWSGHGNRVVTQGADVIGSPYAAPDEAGVAINSNGVWGRIEGSHNHMQPRLSTSDTKYNQNVFKMQAGIDGVLTETENGKLIGGFTVHYAHGKTKTNSAHGDGEISTDGYGLGGTLSWFGENGFYLDGQGQVTWYRSDLTSTTAQTTLTDGNHGFGYALSLESGKRFAINEAWSLTPQAQLTYSNVDFDAFTDVFDADVSLDRGESLQGRLGLTLDHENSWQNANGMLDRTHVYGIANLYYEFLNGTRVNVAETSFSSRNDRVWGGLGVGGSYNWNDDKYAIYGEGLINTSLNNFADSYSVKANVGFKVKW